MNERDDLRHLMMAALDGEISAEERAELERRLAADGELRAEWERLSQLKELTAMSGISSPPKEQWDTYWHSVYNKLERGVGWVLASLGAIVLAGWGLWHWINALLADSDIPSFVRLALFALTLGGAVLLVSVVREKLFTKKHDPYEEVER